MFKRRSLAFVILVLNHFSTNLVASQVSDPIHFPSKGDSCNVVQVNCGGAEQNRPVKGGQEAPRNAGPPGKQGQIGQKGSKGNIGIRGEKGETGESALEMLSTTSCQELNERFGVDKTGYYLMRVNGSHTPVYQYCDFYVYEGTTSCQQLNERFGVDKTGYYLMTVNGPVYQYCDFNVYGAEFTCSRMLERGLYVYKGQYRFRRSDTEIVYIECEIYSTCHQMSALTGVKKSGHYNMKDGESTFQVYCNFASGSAVTEVSHDSTNEIHITKKCSGRGCYSRVPQYEVSFGDMAKIIGASTSCKQLIKYRCQGSVLLYHGHPYGWWVSSGGEKMTYWGGATSRQNGYCACGETGSCVNNSHKCNCDFNSESRTTQDEGYLTDKSKLPVREMKFGDLQGSQNGWHTLGKLECSGQA